MGGEPAIQYNLNLKTMSIGITKKNIIPGKDGYDAMMAWNRTWQMHHMPVWLKKRIRLDAIKKGTWNTGWRAESYLPRDLMDHWGTVRRLLDGHNNTPCGDVFSFITQPYGEHNELARKFAEDMQCHLIIQRPGPWASGTWYYEFIPKV